MDTLQGETLVIDIPDVPPPTTKAKRRKKSIEQEIAAEPIAVETAAKEESIEETVESLKPLVPFIYKSVNIVQASILAKKYTNLDKSQVSDVLDFTDSDVETLTDPTAKILAKRVKILSKFPDEFALLIVLLSLYQVKISTLNDMNERMKQSETEKVQ